jgi:hypothetical protein
LNYVFLCITAGFYAAGSSALTNFRKFQEHSLVLNIQGDEVEQVRGNKSFLAVAALRQSIYDKL